jgi:predicted nucleotidyltransferase
MALMWGRLFNREAPVSIELWGALSHARLSIVSSSEKIALLQSILEKDTRVLLAWVFGSVAQGKARPESDLDVAIVFDHSLSPEEQVEMSRQLESQIKMPVDLLDLSRAHGPIVAEVLCRGIPVIRRSHEQHARLLKRMWLEEADFGPLRRRIQSARRKRVFGT